MKNLIKCLLLGFVMVGFVGCDKVAGMFDKFSYDEIFEYVSENKKHLCSELGTVREFYSGRVIEYNYEFIPPSELTDEDKGLIGVCIYTKESSSGGVYGMQVVDRFKGECKTETTESYTGFSKIDKKSGALLIENKHKVITIVESAEFSMKNKYRGQCKRRVVYKLQRGQPNE
ncbi:hypothetical protein ACWIUD_11230 [Helicobacter sp. 23-1044]